MFFMEVFADGFDVFFLLRKSSMLFVYVLHAIRHVWHAKSTKNELLNSLKANKLGLLTVDKIIVH